MQASTEALSGRVSVVLVLLLTVTLIVPLNDAVEPECVWVGAALEDAEMPVAAPRVFGVLPHPVPGEVG